MSGVMILATMGPQWTSVAGHLGMDPRLIRDNMDPATTVTDADKAAAAFRHIIPLVPTQALLTAVRKAGRVDLANKFEMEMGRAVMVDTEPAPKKEEPPRYEEPVSPAMRDRLNTRMHEFAKRFQLYAVLSMKMGERWTLVCQAMNYDPKLFRSQFTSNDTYSEASSAAAFLRQLEQRSTAWLPLQEACALLEFWDLSDLIKSKLSE